MSRMSANRRARRLIGSAAIASALFLGSLAGSAVTASAANGLAVDPSFSVLDVFDLLPDTANGLEVGTDDANGVEDDTDANGVRALPSPGGDATANDSKDFANGV